MKTETWEDYYELGFALARHKAKRGQALNPTQTAWLFQINIKQKHDSTKFGLKLGENGGTKNAKRDTFRLGKHAVINLDK